MPTGYTASVVDGTATTLLEYGMACVAHFLGTSEERSKANQERFEVHRCAVERLKEFQEASDVELKNRQQMERAEKLQQLEQLAIDAEQELVRIQAMLDKLDRYHPPTVEHYLHNRFMRQQLLASRLDPSLMLQNMTEPPIVPFEEWKASKAAKLAQDVADTKTASLRFIAKNNIRNQWIKELREALAAVDQLVAAEVAAAEVAGKDCE